MIVSITHEHDLDGLGSQAIIKRYFDMTASKEEMTFFDANYSNFVEIIKNVISSEKNLTKLIISDIGFNKSFRVLFNLFKSAKARKCQVLWFDHHIVDDSIKDRISNFIEIYINDTLKCAAEIIKDYFLPNDLVAIKIAEFARDTDFKTDKFELASKIQSIIGYNLGSKGFQNRRILVDKLSEGKFTDPWFDSQTQELEKWLKKETEKTIENAKKIHIENFGDVYISYAQIGGGRITQILNKEFPNSKAYIGIDLRYNEIIIHSDFVQCREFAMYFGGGGHEDRAGFTYPNTFADNNELSKHFITDITKIILKFRK